MPKNVIEDLRIDEVSLVSAPANSETVNGKKIPRAIVALAKFDTSGHKQQDLAARRDLTERCGRFDREVKKELAASRERAKPKTKDDPGTINASAGQRKGKKKMKVKKILKSGTATREQICQAVERRALKIAKREGTEVTSDILERAWTENGAYQAHERAPVAVQKRAEPRTAEITSAEAELDTRARKRMKKNAGLSYAKACSEELTADPSLYQKYEAELASGKTYTAPAPPEFRDPTMKRGKAKSDDSECPKCGDEVDEDDKFCAGCGTKLDASAA